MSSLICAQTPPQSWQPPVLLPGTPNIYAKQGYPKEQSAALLDPEVRQLLDTALRLYREPGLFVNRSKALAELGVQNTSRRYSLIEPVEGGYRAYVDTFSKEGLFARPAWTGVYRYSGKIEPWLNDWHEAIRIDIDEKLECHNSRAVEGYLDLVLDPGGRGSPHRRGNPIQRHDVILGEPYAPPLTPTTPALSLKFSNGCLIRLTIAGILNYKDISDDNARN